MIQVAEGSCQRRASDGDHERALRQAIAEDKADGLVERVLADNQIIPHNFLIEVVRKVSCAHPGCTEPFEVRLVPGQIVYPKWCDFHRPAHRRKLSSVPDRASRSWEESLESGLAQTRSSGSPQSSGSLSPRRATPA